MSCADEADAILRILKNKTIVYELQKEHLKLHPPVNRVHAIFPG